jgi:hypothetical protein
MQCQPHPLLCSHCPASWWSASQSSHFMSRERVSGTHQMGGLVGLRASVDVLEKWKFSCLYCTSNHILPSKCTNCTVLACLYMISKILIFSCLLIIHMCTHKCYYNTAFWLPYWWLKLLRLLVAAKWLGIEQGFPHFFICIPLNEI